MRGVGDYPSIGRGIGMAIGLLVLLASSSMGLHHYFYRTMSIGVLSRAALISALYERSLRLTQKARGLHPNGKSESIDYAACSYCSHMLLTARRSPNYVIKFISWHSSFSTPRHLRCLYRHLRSPSRFWKSLNSIPLLTDVTPKQSSTTFRESSLTWALFPSFRPSRSNLLQHRHGSYRLCARLHSHPLDRSCAVRDHRNHLDRGFLCTLLR
jgi:hypothetical protein